MILVVSSVDVYPIDCGKKTVLAGMLDRLVDLQGAAQVIFCHVGRKPTEQPFAYPCQYRFVRMPPVAAQALNVLWHSLIRRSASIQEAFFRSRRVGREVSALIDSSGATSVVVDTIRMASCCWRPDFREVGILYMDDLFSVRYRRMLQQAEVDALGNFGINLPWVLVRIVGFEPIQRLLLRWEASAVERSEMIWPKRFFKSLLISEQETALLNSRLSGGHVMTIDPYVPIASKNRSATRIENPEYVFLGSLALAHNEVGLYKFLTEQWSHVRRLLPNARLRIIGKNSSDRLREAVARAGGSVVIEGYVKSLDHALGSATALIAPILFGSGVKLKVLDALARGVPIVSTEVGAEGIPLVHGVHGYIVPLNGFPRAMLSLADPGERARISAACIDLFDGRYGVDAVTRSYAQIFQQPVPRKISFE